MISIEEFRKELGDLAEGMTDEQVVGIRDCLYTIVESVIDDYIAEAFKK